MLRASMSACLSGVRLGAVVALGTFAAPAIGAAQTPSETDVLTGVQAEVSGLDAEIQQNEQRLARLDLKVGELQQEAAKINAAAATYANSTEVQRQKKNYDDYQRTCAGKTLYGAQIASCSTWKSKLEILLQRHNQTMMNFKAKFDAANRKVQEAKNEAVLARAAVQKLKNYKSWLDLAIVKMADDLQKQCGASGASPEEMKHRCGNVQFDGARLSLPPCEGDKCRPLRMYMR